MRVFFAWHTRRKILRNLYKLFMYSSGLYMKKIGIGYENYKQFTDQNLYYVDKTLLVQDVLEKGGAVTLITRPRRFGKTLALSMLRTFFELEYDRDGNVIDKRRYFEGRTLVMRSCQRWGSTRSSS